MTSLKIKTVADHGYSNARRIRRNFRRASFDLHRSYDLKHAFCESIGLHTQRRGVAYPLLVPRHEAVTRSSGHRPRAQKLNMDPAELRMKTFIKPEQFPVQIVLAGVRQRQLRRGAEESGWTSSATMPCAAAGRDAQEGELMASASSSFTNLGAGPSRDFDILGIKMFDSAEIRVHPTGKRSRALHKSQGPGTKRPTRRSSRRAGHSRAHVAVERATPTRALRAWHYASRSKPTSGAARARLAQDPRQGAENRGAPSRGERQDLEWEPGNSSLRERPDGEPSRSARSGVHNHPQGMRRA